MTAANDLPTTVPAPLLPGQAVTIHSPDGSASLVRVVHGVRGRVHEPHRVERLRDGEPPEVLALFFAPGRLPAEPQALRLPRPVAIKTGSIADAIAYGQRLARDLWAWLTIDQTPDGGIH